MSEQSKFKDEEIHRHFQQQQSRRKNTDYDQLQARKDILFAARNDTPEEFQARLIRHGIDLTSDRGRKVMEAFWAIRRETPR